MCGIAGAYAFATARLAPADVVGMVQALAHRGPDDAGFASFDAGGRAHAWTPRDDAPPAAPARCTLGNRRLSIFDLSPAGHQPMADPTGRWWIAYNGEVYNHVELRHELEALGHRFRSHCDTEVLLAAFVQWGAACFARMNGMWAAAIYDTREHTLVLSRDRFGVKPLYVHRAPDGLRFGSEVKALLADPAVPRTPDLRTLFDYAARHYRWVDGGRRTFYAGIEHLPPGHTWTVHPDGRVDEERFWDLDATRRRDDLSDEQALEGFRDLFRDAVGLRLRADVPVATLLSGGLDSSSVTVMAAALSDAPVTTFSARFDERDFDEGPYIEATAAAVGADARFVYPRAAELLPTLDRMLDFHDEPVCTATWFAHWLVMEQVAGLGFPVILNGHVGDELFGGYWDHQMYRQLDLLRSGDRDGFEHEQASWLAAHGRDPQEYARTVARIEALEQGRLGPADPLTQYASAVAPEVRAAADVQERPARYADRDVLSERLYQELRYETVPATLRPEDRNSMAFSIESRSPFLDYRLVEFAFSLPGRFKVRDGLGKWIVREGMRGLLPELVRTRRDKQGLVAPAERWYRGEAAVAVREVLASPELRAHGVLDQAEVLRCFDEHAAGHANHYLQIWQWLNLELWMRKAPSA